MNILIGPLNDKNEKSILSSAYILGDYCNSENIRIFNNLNGKISLSFEEILAEAETSDWKADVFVFWRPEYEPLPDGLDKSRIPVVAVIIDWSIEAEILLTVVNCFDWIFIDKPGVDFFRRHGHTNVSHWLFGGYIPELHRKIAGEPKVLDIIFIGGLNHSIHKHRSRLLYRLAKLSGKYRIKITGGVYGEDYVTLLNRSRIVFNHSIRSELNMRAYEAMACGSLLFMEEENEEAGMFFKPGTDFVAYNENNLESLLEYYLKNQQEADLIACNGYKTVLSHTYEAHFADLICKIKSLAFIRNRKANTDTSKTKLIPSVIYLKQLFRPNSHILLLGNNLDSYFSAVCGQYKTKLPELQGNSDFFNNLAICSVLEKYLNKIDFADEIKYFQRAVEINSYSVATFNLGLFYIMLKKFSLAEVQLNIAREMLETGVLEVSGLLLDFNYSGTLKLKTEAAFFYDNATVVSGKRVVLLDKTYELLADIYTRKKFFYLAKSYYEKIKDKSAVIYFKLAELALMNGNTDESLNLIHKGIEEEPFNLKALTLLKVIYTRTGNIEAALTAEKEIINLKEVNDITGYLNTKPVNN